MSAESIPRAALALALTVVACEAAPDVWPERWLGISAGPNGEVATLALRVRGATATATAALTPVPRAVALRGAVGSSRVELSGETGTIYGTYSCTATRSSDQARGECTLADQATRPLLLLVNDGGRRVCGNYFLPDEDGVLLVVVTDRALGAIAFGETLRWTATSTRPADRDRLSIREGEVTLTGRLGPDGASGELLRDGARGTFTLNAETCPQRTLAR